jgi:hypothetical protein
MGPMLILLRHVHVHHPDRHRDDPELKVVMSQRLGKSRGRLRRALFGPLPSEQTEVAKETMPAPSIAAQLHKHEQQ